MTISITGVPRQSCIAAVHVHAHPFIHSAGGWLGLSLETAYVIIQVVWGFFPENPSHALFCCELSFTLLLHWVQFGLWIKFAQMKVDLSTFQSPPTTHLPAPHFSIMVLAHSPVFPTNLCSGSFLVIIMALKSLNSASSTWLATTGKWCWLSWMNWLRGWADNHRNYKVWHCIFFLSVVLSPAIGATISNVVSWRDQQTSEQEDVDLSGKAPVWSGHSKRKQKWFNHRIIMPLWLADHG